MIEDYKIVEAYSHYETESRVCTLIREGWIPFGNLQVTYASNDNYRYVQAMVKYKTITI